jgi:NAD+ synthase (glutamine-hydrolysing)
MSLRVCLAQINATVGDINGNAVKILDYTNRAAGLDADIVVFPELALCGYPPEDLLLKPDFIKASEKKLLEIAKVKLPVLSVIGFPFCQDHKIYNAAALIYNGRIVDIYKKIFLPNYGVFDEKRYFDSGVKCSVISFGGEVKAGINICEDIWVPEGPQRAQSRLGGAGVIINLSSSPYYSRKIEEREILLSNRARENRAYVLYCNMTGGQDELVFDGGSMAFSPSGKILARGKQFDEDMVIVDIEASALRKKPSKSKALKIIRLPKPKEKLALAASNKIEPKLKTVSEIYLALTMGVKDYVRKNGFQKVILGLSGGIDSALTAAIAVDALGEENVIAITMPSEFTSRGTKTDSIRTAENLNIDLKEIPIGDVYHKYLKMFKKYFKSRPADITEENLQPRIRANILMAFSNKFGWLVLTTGNKSEVSTGYCTLYGDMAGGFDVLKDVPKMLVYELSEWRNRQGDGELIPKSTIKRAPTADLKRNQTDQDTLPPYDVLDKILALYVEKDLNYKDITAKGFDPKVVLRVINMVDRNEYKRRQSAPGVKITPKAFGKDRRLPISNAFPKNLLKI